MAWMRVLSLAVALAILCAIPLMAGRYLIFVLDLAAVYAVAALGLNLLLGCAGQISFAHVTFLGIGSYSYVLLADRLGMSFWLALPAAGLITAAIGVLVGLPSSRLNGIYQAIFTLGIGMALVEVMSQWKSLTNGLNGLNIPGRPRIGSFEFSNDYRMYYIILLVALPLVWLAVNLTRGRIGRAFRAVRGSELVAQTMGIRVGSYKVLAFALSAFYAGVAGALFALLITYVNPEMFNLQLMINMLIMIVVGGLGSVWGSLVGATFLTVLVELLRQFRDYQLVALSAALILVLIFLPSGISGTLGYLVVRFLRRRADPRLIRSGEGRTPEARHT